MTKANVTVPHEVSFNPQGEFCLIPVIDPVFMKAMSRLYPAFASYTKADKGYSAFARAPEGEFTFIGSFGGLTLQSVRKNPLLSRGDDRFVRALLGGLYLDGYEHHASVCSAKNYGTLSLWKKLGLGAKVDSRGKARSAPGAIVSLGVLTDLRDKARDEYEEHRVIAARALAQFNGAFPVPEHGALLERARGTSYSLDVVLS